MRHFKIDTSIEDLKSRIPGMFAYVEFGENGQAVLHPAVDSVDGCYGKIVENIVLPCGVNLCTYVEVLEDSIPATYAWTDANTERMDSDPAAYYTDIMPEYLRHPVSFSYVRTEEAHGVEYTEYDELPDPVGDDDALHAKVKDRDKEGNTYKDCDGNVAYVYYDKEAVYGYYGRRCIFSEGETYGYRTLIYYYYKLRDSLGKDNVFISFMEEGIGKVYLDKAKIGVANRKVYPDVPDSIYLAESGDLYNRYNEYGKLKEYYKTHYTDMGLENRVIEERLERYERMGGDRVKNWLLGMTDVAQKVSERYLCYADNRAYSVSAWVDIPLFSSSSDLGYRETYVNSFVSGERYMHGDIFTYNGKTYVCLLDRYAAGGENFAYVRCNGVYKKATEGGYVEIVVEKVYDTVLPVDLYHNAQYIQFQDGYYVWDGDGYVPMDMVEYASSRVDGETMQAVFDTQHFVPITELAESVWYNADNLLGESNQVFYDTSVIPTEFVCEYIRHGGNIYRWDSTQYVPDMAQGGVYTIHGQTSSVLASFRNLRHVLTREGRSVNPSPDEDWLANYTVGSVPFHTENTDESGNIVRDNSESVPVVGEYVNDLQAYGNVLLGISCDTEGKTLTFRYVVNGHLKAVLREIGNWINNSQVYRYGPFEYDWESPSGVVYTETYTYEDPMIDLLVANGDFENFVNGNEADIEDYYEKYGFSRFVFQRVLEKRDMRYASADISSEFVPAEYTEEVENVIDALHSPLFHRDWCNGVMFAPTVESDVNVGRGNAAFFERNLRLGEVRSIEDMENEQNGSIFRMSV